MRNDNNTQKLLELLKYYSADDLKREQTQFTKTANKIRDTANGRLSVLFSENEIQTLRDAATLLTQLKGRVEHAKEIRTREEARKEQEFKDNMKAARETVNKAFPESDNVEDRIKVLVWALLLEKSIIANDGNHENYRSRYTCWNIDSGNLENELKRWFDAADTWQAEHTLDGKIVCSHEERRSAPMFMTTAAFFNELRYRLSDVLESDLNSYKSGFAERFEELRCKSEKAIADIIETKHAYLEHFRSKQEASTASQKFINNIRTRIL